MLKIYTIVSNLYNSVKNECYIRMYIRLLIYVRMFSLRRHYDIIDPSAQLVCKYLNAYENRTDVKKSINRLYNERDGKF